MAHNLAMDKKRLRLVFAVAVFIQMSSYAVTVVQAGDTLSLGASVAGNQTLISENGKFELGFFSPNGTNNWYVGMWYGNMQQKMIVWVANGETPARNKPGVLKLSREGELDLLDAEGASIWSVNISKKASRAVILDSGNFLMLSSDDNKSETVWQSFDIPTDIWLPGMRFGEKLKLVSWKSSLDPAPGLFSFQLDPSSSKQIVLMWNNSVRYWSSGVWDGRIFSRVPEMTDKRFFNVSVEITSSSLYVSLTPTHNMRAPMHFILTKSGDIRLAQFDGNKWSMFWSLPRDECAVYGLCGAFGVCNSMNSEFCSCVNGFTPKEYEAWDSRDWSTSSCVRQSPLNCTADRFIESNATSFNDYGSSLPAPTKTDCEKACLSNCSCTAYAFNPPSGPCQIWSTPLFGLRDSSSISNSNVFIRVAAASALATFDPPSSSQRKTVMPLVIGIVSALAIALAVFSFFMWRRRQDRLRSTIERYEDSSDSFLRMFSYKELKIATRNFRSKLGSGGFGSVFKGSLPDGTLVAVKKLESNSSRDEKQFRAEISSLGNIQHGNLVRLRGFCAQGSKVRLLVYDYMPNGSLDSILFSSGSKSKNKILDWKARFKIALGTARALFYLHEECRDRIIHGDVKPENILLDADFSPKLADFGLAKLVNRDLSRILTTTRGTRGYLAPEWISGVPITPKVDVYSFGMTLLEIISGRRTLDLDVQDSSMYYFPPWAATQISQGNTINVVEKGVAEEEDIEEVRRASVVALLCIERDEEMRPTMGQVVLMLEGKMEPSRLKFTTPVLVGSRTNQSNTTESDSVGNVVNLG